MGTGIDRKQSHPRGRRKSDNPGNAVGIDEDLAPTTRAPEAPRRSSRELTAARAAMDKAKLTLLLITNRRHLYKVSVTMQLCNWLPPKSQLFSLIMTCRLMDLASCTGVLLMLRTSLKRRQAARSFNANGNWYF